MDSEQLKRFIVELPSKLDFSRPVAIRQNLFKALYYASSVEGKYLKELFPIVTDEEVEGLKNYEFAISDVIVKRPFFNYKQKASYTHAAGSACARPFRKGEPVYRCEQCGFDETCVLCVHCFNKDDHADHNVYMYISQGNSNGICDCGDREAFVNELHCKCQMDEEQGENNECLAEELDEALKQVIRVCLDYILDVTNFSVTRLPYIHKCLGKLRSPFNPKFLSDMSCLSSERYGGSIDANSDNKWYLILWNDEHHSREEAIQNVISAKKVNRQKAESIADEVDSSGRCILHESSSLVELQKMQSLVEVDGLYSSIVSARDYMRECIVAYMLNWLSDITQFSNNIKFKEASKEHLGNLLLEPGFHFDKHFLDDSTCEMMRPLSDDTDTKEQQMRKLFENGLLYEGNFVNIGKTKVQDNLEMDKYVTSISGILKSDERLNKLQNSRLQFLLNFEIRFPSSIRKKLANIIIPAILSDGNKKEAFCNQFVTLYPQLITSMARADSEEHLNLLSEISTQLLTCPTSVQNVITDNNIGYILGPVTDIIEKYSTEWNMYSLLPNFVEIARGRTSNYKSIKRAILEGIRDINLLVNKHSEVNLMDVFLSLDNIVLLLLFLRNFQGYWPVERKYGDHVEREVLDFVVHLEYSVPVLNVVKFIASSSSSNIALIRKAIKFITDYLCLREIIWKAPGIAEFRVSKQPVSFVHPINSLLSYIIQFHGFENFQDIFLSMNGPFMRISDISLRSIVLSSQVKIGFWIRNGLSVSRQATLYTDSLMRDSAYFCDFHLNQIAAIIDNPRSTLLNILDRWELLPWFFNEVTQDKTIYDDRFNSISNRLIVFLYNLITDRTNFFNFTSKERLLHRAKMAICYALCDKPKSYSTLKAEVAIEISELPEFDNLLQECCDFQSPSGLIDSGMYRLKSSLFEKLDPLSLHLDTSQFQTVTESLTKNIAIQKKMKEDDVILIPQITLTENEFVNDRLGRFAKTKEFAKLIYKYLQVAIDTSDETYLGNLLHLIHAVMKDDESLHTDSYLCENFITIPISDLLFTITESRLSKFIVRKAEFLLTSFMEKDDRVLEALVDCFGAEHVQSFRSKHMSTIKSEPEKRKLLAEKRKSKVLKKFAKQREQFLFKNGDMVSQDSQEGEEGKSNGIEHRTCVLCGESETSTEIFGLLANVSKSSVFWRLNDDVDYFSLAFRSWDDQPTPKSHSVFGKGYDYFRMKSTDAELGIAGDVISNCGHGMHFLCYRLAATAFKFYPCPLCRNLSNTFIPSYLPSAENHKVHQDSLIYGEPLKLKYNQLTSSTGVTKFKHLMLSLVDETITEQTDEAVLKKIYAPLVEELLPDINNRKYLPGVSKQEKYFNQLQNLSNVIANTIRMSEISIRIEGNSSYSNFLNQIPSTTKTLIKSLIQIRSVLYEKRALHFFLGSDNDLINEVSAFWDSSQLLDSIFNEVVVLFFQTDESLKTLTRWGLVKLLTVSLYHLIIRLNSDDAYFHTIEGQSGHILSKSDEYNIREVALSIIAQMESSFSFTLKKTIPWHGLWKCTERLSLPFLRNIIIFGDLLTSRSLGDNVHESLENFKSLEDEVQSQSYLDSTDALCKTIKIPTISELFHELASQDGLEFERNIFDIVLRAKVPKYFDHGILSVDYPGVVKLIDLPTDYNSCIMENNASLVKGIYDYTVCLHCGLKLRLADDMIHMQKCNSLAIFFHPRLNVLKLVTKIANSPIFIKISAPYLTSHGEVKRPRSSGKATLNHLRYAYLNKLWLNEGLNGFITRSMFGTMDQPQETDNDILMGNVDDLEEDDDEFNFFYQDDFTL